MGIDICETHCAAGRSLRTEKASEDDAAVAAEQDHKTPAVGGGRHAVAERRGVRGYLGFVARTSRRANEISIRRRNNITEIESAYTLNQTEFAEYSRSAIQMPYFTAVVRTDTNARWRANDGNRATVHIVSFTCVTLNTATAIDLNAAHRCR
jgi:hypothetical protein